MHRTVKKHLIASLIIRPSRVTAVLILHNMKVEDRVMQREYRSVYRPSQYVADEVVIVEQPRDLAQVQRLHRPSTGALAVAVGAAQLATEPMDQLTRRE